MDWDMSGECHRSPLVARVCVLGGTDASDLSCRSIWDWLNSLPAPTVIDGKALYNGQHTVLSQRTSAGISGEASGSAVLLGRHLYRTQTMLCAL